MFSRAQIPNIITVVRIALVPPIGALLWYGAVREALVLMAIASASDALDGWLARHFGWISRFGAAMDPVADKLLVGTLFVIFTLKGIIPLWVVLIIIGRDVIIMLGAIAYRVLFEAIEFAPTYLSKANTAMQIVMLLLLLLGQCGFGWISEAALALVDPYCFWFLAALGVTSGLDYVVTWSLRALRRAKAAQ
ncbi:MAG: CDP-alcohol phosphatidyltransferase family protein [Pseudomonadales bacterium]|nr:CDP-alcohol phosphatidyltransferase family protein [Pseudomonadales bacterium]NIX06534.1 CDP-alcohol phosphatidyltransferase family protein [Pseudomonadales bacterium]